MLTALYIQLYIKNVYVSHSTLMQSNVFISTIFFIF